MEKEKSSEEFFLPSLADYNCAIGKFLVRPIEAQKKTKSGLFIPDGSQTAEKQKPEAGIVVKAGEGCVDIQLGMYVYYQRYRDFEIPLSEGVFKSVPYEEIHGFAVVKKD